MNNTEQELFRLLREVWAAHSLCYPEGRRFDEEEFIAFTPQERASYIGRVNGYFAGRECALRPLIEGGFIRKSFDEEYWVVLQQYWKEVAEGDGDKVQ